MNPKTKATLIILNFIIVLGVVNGAIWKKHTIVNAGRTILLELAPVDPRSLMQGDYMVLSYTITDDDAFSLGPPFLVEKPNIPTRGRMILKVGTHDIAIFSRIATDDEKLAADEIFLKYRKLRRGFRFGIESFFFQEGRADHYQNAKYAELRVSENGEPVIVELRPKFDK